MSTQSRLSMPGKVGVALAYIALVAWLLVSSLALFMTTAMGTDGCAPDCVDRAGWALLMVAVVHLGAIVYAGVVAFGNASFVKRVLTFVVIGLAVPVLSFLTAYEIVV